MRAKDRTLAPLPAYATFTIVEHTWSSNGRSMRDWMLLDNWGEIVCRHKHFDQAERFLLVWLDKIRAWGAPYDLGHR